MSDLTYRQLADKIAQMSDADKDCAMSLYWMNIAPLSIYMQPIPMCSILDTLPSQFS